MGIKLLYLWHGPYVLSHLHTVVHHVKYILHCLHVVFAKNIVQKIHTSITMFILN